MHRRSILHNSLKPHPQAMEHQFGLDVSLASETSVIPDKPLATLESFSRCPPCNIPYIIYIHISILEC